MRTRAEAGGTKPLHTMDFTYFRCRRFPSIIQHFPYGLSLEAPFSQIPKKPSLSEGARPLDIEDAIRDLAIGLPLLLKG